MTYKLMEPKFPENVKNGVKISVQGRLAKALEKSGKGIVSSDGSSQVKLEKGAIPKNFDKIERSKSNKDKENSGYHYFSLDDWWSSWIAFHNFKYSRPASSLSKKSKKSLHIEVKEIKLNLKF